MDINTRRSERKALHAPISPLLRWNGSSGEYDGCISNVSVEGCFLNTTGAAEVGESISFNASLPSDELIEMRGTVVHRQERPAGFGVRFDTLTDRELNYLKLLMADSEQFANHP
jgi:hypothetical protein